MDGPFLDQSKMKGKRVLMKNIGFSTLRCALDGVLVLTHDHLRAGGFRLCGIPSLSIAAIREAEPKTLTGFINNAGVDEFGLVLLLRSRQVKKIASSYVGENADIYAAISSGEAGAGI